MRLWFAFLLLAECAAAGVFYQIVTAAGSSWDGDGGPATSAIFYQAEGIASDAKGNLYISDAAGHRVRKVTPAGVISTVAGTGIAGFSGDGGPAAAAQLNSPYGLALDGAGRLYIADLGNARVRCVDLDGTISTVAGGGSLPAGGSNDGSDAVLLALSAPRNLAWDGNGNLYIADFTGQRVYRLDSSGTLTTAAGTGVAGFSGDGFAAINARLAYPAAIAVDRSGTLWIGDTQNHLVRKVANGRISSIVNVDLPTGMAVDAIGAVYVADQAGRQIVVIPPAGKISAYPITAHDICFRADGYLYSADVTTAQRISFSSGATIVAGGGNTASGDGGPAASALLQHPAGVSTSAQGDLYIADRDNNRIRRVAPDGTITTIAGTGAAGDSADYQLAIHAQLNAPSSVTPDANGNLYIADTGNHRIRVVSAGGEILPFTSVGLVSPVYAIPDGKGNVYVADDNGGIYQALPSGAVNPILTNLKHPRGLFLDSAGNLYFTEAGGPHVKRLGVAGDITLIAEGAWNTPRGIAVDSSGNIFVADTGLQQIVEVSPAGAVNVIAGNGTAGFSGDGSAALAAEFNFPWDVALGAGGSLYIADLLNNRIRQLTPASTPTIAPILIVTAVNAASLQPGPIAPGMLIALNGAGLTSTSGVQVSFGGIASPFIALNGSSLLAEVPPEIEGEQSVQIQLFSQGSLLAQIPETVVEAAPALYTDSTGRLIAMNQDGSLNSPSNPAPRGSIVVIFGTGQGVSAQPIAVTIGGYAANILYAGPVSGYPGLLQINATVPAGYIGTGQMPVIVTAGAASTQPGLSIWID
jgi:uncharacterized protein (TIGR03437 family)